MTYFLTSCTVIPGSHDLNPANGFAARILAHLPQCPLRGIYLASDPADHACNDLYGNADRTSFENSGCVFADYQIYDDRNEQDLTSLLKHADLVILAGGHVPTQQKFFSKIGLREKLSVCSGVVVGISAGSMNGADTVYAQPERSGEATDPAYRRFLPGLGLTKTMLLPHYDLVKDDVLDGQRLYEDITCGDSFGRTFYAIPDGSYLYGHNGMEELWGEAHRIRDGVITQVGFPDTALRL
jgi:dipeptidase E